MNPRGSRRRGQEVLRLNAKVKCGFEYKLKTLVLSDDNSLYEYKHLTKRVCGALFDWSRAWTCIGNKGPTMLNEWLGLMEAKGWFKPNLEEKHLRHLGKPAMEPIKVRQHKRAENARIGSKPLPTPQPVSKLVIRQGLPHGVQATLNRMKKEERKGKE